MQLKTVEFDQMAQPPDTCWSIEKTLTTFKSLGEGNFIEESSLESKDEPGNKRGLVPGKA